MLSHLNIAQPEDSISRAGIFPRIGIYDDWSIEWGYRWMPEFKTAEDEIPHMNKWIISKLKEDKRYTFGTESDRDDPCQNEDLETEPPGPATRASPVPPRAQGRCPASSRRRIRRRRSTCSDGYRRSSKASRGLRETVAALPHAQRVFGQTRVPLCCGNRPTGAARTCAHSYIPRVCTEKQN